MSRLRSVVSLATVAWALVACDKPDDGAPAASTEPVAADTGAAAATATETASAAPTVKPLPADPAPKTVSVDFDTMKWKDLTAGKELDLVDTDLGKCGLTGWHVPLPKGIFLSPLSPLKGKGCSAKNMPGPSGTQLMVVVGGTALPAKDIKNVKATPFEASDGYILELDNKGAPPFYPRMEHEVGGELVSCSLTYVDFDTARAAYEICRRLEKKP